MRLRQYTSWFIISFFLTITKPRVEYERTPLLKGVTCTITAQQLSYPDTETDGTVGQTLTLRKRTNVENKKKGTHYKSVQRTGLAVSVLLHWTGRIDCCDREKKQMGGIKACPVVTPAAPFSQWSSDAGRVRVASRTSCHRLTGGPLLCRRKGPSRYVQAYVDPCTKKRTVKARAGYVNSITIRRFRRSINRIWPIRYVDLRT